MNVIKNIPFKRKSTIAYLIKLHKKIRVIFKGKVIKLQQFITW